MRRQPGIIRLAAFAGVAGFTLAGAPPALAQPAEEYLEQGEAGEAGAAYGRLLYFDGPITVNRVAGFQDEPLVNDPLVPGDVMITGAGRAEIQLADGSLVTLDHDTELALLSLSDNMNLLENTTILQLASGSIILDAARMDSSEKRFQIDTDAASAFLLSDGLFRIDARPDGSTVIMSRRGVVEVLAQDVSTIVRSGERITVRPFQIPGEPQAYNTRIMDEFDVWVTRREEALLARQRIDDQYPAGLPEPVRPYATELTYYGSWYRSPAFGWVWRPVGLHAGWQPYTYGRWVPSPAGLVWVSHEPWGWAPFHYGRWELLFGTGWVWIPGNVFSGAYVAWSLSPGYFGWCPLGYYDRPLTIHASYGGYHHPWVYVGQHHLYDRRVHESYIRDVTVVRTIEKERVIVRGIPVVEPHKAKSYPKVAEEFHRQATVRGVSMKIDEERRMPFHEKERQRQVTLNRMRTGERQQQGLHVSTGREGRPVTVTTPSRGVSVPERGLGTNRTTGRQDREPDRPPARAATPQRGVPQRGTGDIPGVQGSSTPSRRNPGATSSTPDRIRRIIPRSGGAGGHTSEPSVGPRTTPGRSPARQPSVNRGAVPSGKAQGKASPASPGKGGSGKAAGKSGGSAKSSGKNSGKKGSGSGGNKGGSGDGN